MHVHYDAISPAYYGLQIENDGATAYLLFSELAPSALPLITQLAPSL